MATFHAGIFNAGGSLLDSVHLSPPSLTPLSQNMLPDCKSHKSLNSGCFLPQIYLVIEELQLVEYMIDVLWGSAHWLHFWDYIPHRGVGRRKKRLNKVNSGKRVLQLELILAHCANTTKTHLNTYDTSHRHTTLYIVAASGPSRLQSCHWFHLQRIDGKLKHDVIQMIQQMCKKNFHPKEILKKQKWNKYPAKLVQLVQHEQQAVSPVGHCRRSLMSP